MIEAGWIQFLKSPILGIGVGNAGLAARTVGIQDFWAYLHNNYIELLCGGGIIGFSIYYAKYVYVFVRYIQLKEHLGDLLYPCVIIYIIKLILDYGLVSYFEKPYEIHFLLLYLPVKYCESMYKNRVIPIENSRTCKYIKGDCL